MVVYHRYVCTEHELCFPAALTANKAVTGWGDVLVNPNAFLSAMYRGFRINIYKTANDTNLLGSVQYFYPPALFIDPASAKTYLNTLQEDRPEMSFTVLMWDEEYEEFVREAVSRRLGQRVPKESIRVLPIEQIRIDALGFAPSNYEIVNNWVSYAAQPSTFDFRFSCINMEVCEILAQQVKKNPQLFVYDLEVSYSLITVRAARRIVQVKAEHVQAGRLFSQLQQQVPNTSVVYMKADDLTQMTLEIATNVMATEVVDDEFIGQDQSITITNILESLLQMKPESSASFQAQMWDSVFWKDENTRPDRVTSTLNEFYEKSDDERKDRMKEVLAQSQTSSSSGGGSTTLGVLGVSVQASMQMAFNDSSSFASDYEQEQFIATMTEASGKSQWSGERFIVKPMQLVRTNIARLQNSATVTSVQVRVARSAAQLTSRINLLVQSPSNNTAQFSNNTELSCNNTQLSNNTSQSSNNTATSDIPPGSIQMFYGVEIPVGWLLCDGAAVNCSIYQNLCRVLRGVNAANIRTPDLRGRTAIGAGNAQLPHTINDPVGYYFSVGATGGEVNHKLSLSEMPTHSHSYTTPRIPHYYPIKYKKDDGTNSWEFLFREKNTAFEASQTTESSGSSSVHNNMQPYLALNFIIKT
ncbi:uncharacterized protein LOC129581650 isoform X2 [Paramacrobiotus metropolitanus]|uniref:uncharacterized protein LOC129581650 isoform X2 n=1 Tax=Paramacrobiotus metropolitanus TaxID=2943436 RepID=UPI002445BF2F|nr:uncharacterized protein LOC129581650 isoform X2 [Paramacrobiotus metropolitanus]